ncbi:ParA family protein [Lacticaseibacillus sharpeae]|uniref:ParA family protein n=1 Tax=Lacticaseibacillus sharpeae TaxID=1626 RepID=UPI0006D1C352|nr:AAA family ATPase [Lacticaseibacillus sharpeae]
MTNKIIAFANQKGGVAKTTTVAELGELLSQQFGKKVLMIDMDPQSSLTAIRTDQIKLSQSGAPTMTNVMLRQSAIEDTFIALKPNLWLAPATLTLSDAELSLVQATLRELVLKNALEKLKRNPVYTFDYILVDCPPSRGLLTVNALSASDLVVIPVQAEYQALLGRQLVKKTISEVQAAINDQLQIYGYVMTMASRTNISKEASEILENDSIPVLGTIPRSTRVTEAGVNKVSTYEFEKENPAGVAYRRLAEKLIKEV